MAAPVLTTLPKLRVQEDDRDAQLGELDDKEQRRRTERQLPVHLGQVYDDAERAVDHNTDGKVGW